jgi:S-formylglutathione hydrolase FrmB
MRSALILLLGLIGLIYAQNITGTVTLYSINSAVLGFPRQIQVYLPRGYSNATQYPVVYFLHGFIGDHTSFGYLNEVVDQLIVNGTIPPLIVIKPNGAVNGTVPPIGSLWANSVKNGRFEDYFLKEIVPWAENNFSIKRQRQYRLLMGHSFGASGSVRLGLQNLDVFGSVASHSGFVKMDQWLVQFYVNTSVYNENNHSAISPAGSKLFTTFILTGASAWSPNLTKPFGVDLPMVDDGSGTLDLSVVSKWEFYSPHKVIVDNLANLTTKPFGLFYMDIGRNDELLLLQPNLDFAGQVFNLGVKTTMVIYDGPHNNPALLRLRFAESISDWSAYLDTLKPPPPPEVITISGSDTGTNRTLVIALSVTGGVVGLAIIIGIIVYIGIRSKWHVLLLDKKLTEDETI